VSPLDVYDYVLLYVYNVINIQEISFENTNEARTINYKKSHLYLKTVLSVVKKQIGVM